MHCYMPFYCLLWSVLNWYSVQEKQHSVSIQTSTLKRTNIFPFRHKILWKYCSNRSMEVKRRPSTDRTDHPTDRPTNRKTYQPTDDRRTDRVISLLDFIIRSGRISITRGLFPYLRPSSHTALLSVIPAAVSRIVGSYGSFNSILRWGVYIEELFNSIHVEKD